MAETAAAAEAASQDPVTAEQPAPPDTQQQSAAAGANAETAEPAAAAALDGAAAPDALDDGPQRQEQARAALLALRPFGEQMAEVVAGLRLKSRTAESVRFLNAHVLGASADPSAAADDVAGYPGAVAALARVVADGPALPEAAGAMAALARLCLGGPEGRAKMRAEAAAVSRVVRFLGLFANYEQQGQSAEAAALLVLNLANDKLARRALVAAGAVESLAALLAKGAAPHTSALAAYVAGALLALVAADGGGDELAHNGRRFIAAGGVRAACCALATRPRADASRSTLRLRLLLAHLCRQSPAWEATVAAAAAEAASAALPPLPLTGIAPG